MIRLVPDWAHHYKEFWEAIDRRNLLFIRLRYVAICLLLLVEFIPEFIFHVWFSPVQSRIINSIIISMLAYNVTFHLIRTRIKYIPGKFNPLHFSLLQIILDLIALTGLVYIMGGIENPLFMFYIFHIIIGSLILPGYVIYTISFTIIIVVSSIVLCEYYQIIPHYGIQGLLQYHLYDNVYFVLIFLSVFAVMMIVSVFLANRIAKQLYTQQERFLDTLDKLNAAEIAKQKYIMGVVHEIKTPIAAGQSLIEIAIDGYLGEINDQIMDKLKRIRTRMTQSLELINNILKISQLKLIDDAVKDNVDLIEIVDNVIKNNEDSINEKKIDLLFEKEIKSKNTIEADKSLIQLAISNILRNAVKYSNENGRIVISIFYEENYIKLQVCDDGIGVPSQELEKIFDKYYRASNIDSIGAEGSGFGLSLVKEIIEQHSGQIDAASPSQIGKPDSPGTCFTIKLPYIFKDGIREKPSKLTEISRI